ncbi:MAG: carboxypeptidase regulatory-like domain-containing protein [Acidobacteriota bacterium]
MGRWLRGVLVLAAVCVGAARGQERPLYSLETWPGAQPVEASREDLRGRTCSAPCLLWEGDGGAAFCRAGEPFPAALPGGRTLQVRVLNPDGAPARGIRVAWGVAGWPALPAPWGEKPTDSEGVVSLRVPPAEKVTLWVNEEAWATGAVEADPEIREAVMLLQPAPADVFRILDGTGRPVSGARLLTIPRRLLADPLATTRLPGFGITESRADEYGRVLLPPQEEESAGWVLAAGYRLREWEGPSNRTIRLEPVGPVRLLLRPEKGVKVPDRLTVRTSSRMPGIPWAPLALSMEVEPSEARAFPFTRGVAVEVAGEGLEAVLLQGLEEHEGKSVEVPLRRGARLGGVVLTEGGDPVHGALVVVEGLPRSGASWTRSGEKGRFLLASLPKGTWNLNLSANGFLGSTFGPYGPEDRTDLRLVLRRGAAVRGRVGGEEADEVQVLLKADSQEATNVWQQNVAVLKEGSFEVGGLRAGDYALLAWSAQKGRACVKFTLAEGEEKDLGDLAFQESPRVTGTVEGPDGEPWDKGADVRLKRILKAAEAATTYPPRILTARAGTDGAFSFTGVPEGRYEIGAASEGHGSPSRKIEVAEEDVDVGSLTLKPSGRLSGRLVSRGGKAVEGWLLELKTQAYDPSAPKATAEADGSFDFGEVASGSYRLEVYDGQGPAPRGTRAVRMEEGREAFVLWPIEGVSFTALLQAGGRPAGGATLVVEPASDGFEEGGMLQVSGAGSATLFGMPARLLRAKADEAGFVSMADACPGPAHAALFWEGAQYVAPVDVPDREGVTVSWNFSGVALQGHVVDGAGMPVPRAAVSFAYEGFGESPTRGVETGADGTFSFPSLGAGQILLTARAEGGRTGTLVVEVKDQPLSGLLIRLENGNP